MNIKSIYTAVCDYFNPKPVVEESIKSGKSYADTVEAMQKFYHQRYWLILKANYGLLFNKEASYNFLSALKELYTGLLSVVVSIMYVLAMLVLILVWEPLKFLFRLPFGRIADCAKLDMKAIRKAYTDNHHASSREKENVCGTWRFTATCKNHDDVPFLEGFATGAYSYKACADIEKQIKVHIEPLMVGELSFYSSAIDSENFTINVDYTVANH